MAPTVTLTIAKLAPWHFSATVQLRTGSLSGEGRTKKQAREALEAKLRETGRGIPNWVVKTAPVAATPVPAPVKEPEDFSDFGSDEGSVDESSEVEDLIKTPVFESELVIAQVAPAMAGGFVTPLSDKEAWIKVFRACRDKFDGVEVEGESPREKLANYRRHVDALLESMGYIGAWRLTPGGDHWIRFSGETDHTVRAPQHRSGRVAKDINGMAVDALTGESMQHRREAQRQARTSRGESKGRSKGNTQKYEGDPTAYQAAYKYAAGLSRTAKEAGHGPETARLWYKFGMVVALRAQGALPHTAFEADLAAAGYKEEDIASRVLAFSSTSAAA